MLMVTIVSELCKALQRMWSVLMGFFYRVYSFRWRLQVVMWFQHKIMVRSHRPFYSTVPTRSVVFQTSFFFLYVEISPLKTILSLLIGKPKDAGSGVLLQPRHSLSGNNTDWHLPKPCFELTVAVAWAWYSIWSWRKLQFVSSHGYWCTKNSIVGECSGTLVQNLFRELPNCKCLDTK